MAFPATPADGEIYKDYRYNATKGAWERIDTKNTDKVVVDGQYEIVYNSTTESLDFNYIGS